MYVYSRDDKDYNNALFSSLPFYSIRSSSSYPRMQIILPFTNTYIRPLIIIEMEIINFPIFHFCRLFESETEKWRA